MASGSQRATRLTANEGGDGEEAGIEGGENGGVDGGGHGGSEGEAGGGGDGAS